MNDNALNKIWGLVEKDLNKPQYKNGDFNEVHDLIYQTDPKILSKKFFAVKRNNVNRGKLTLLELLRLIARDNEEDLLKADAFKLFHLRKIIDLLESKEKESRRNINHLSNSFGTLRLRGGKSKKTRRLRRHVNNLRIK